jgi:hypothetical protein
MALLLALIALSQLTPAVPQTPSRTPTVSRTGSATPTPSPSADARLALGNLSSGAYRCPGPYEHWCVVTLRVAGGGQRKQSRQQRTLARRAGVHAHAAAEKRHASC